MSTSTPHNLKLIAALQIFTGVALSAAAYFFHSFELGASTAAGALIMTANSAGLTWAWWRILAKKPIALTLLIIVIKYAVLLSSIYYLARAPWFNAMGAGLGIASFMFAALLFAGYLQAKNPGKDEG
jgi:hypothetical protein